MGMRNFTCCGGWVSGSAVVPLRRYGIPEEVANMTLSVVLPAASFLNGVHIPVDGGLTIKNA